VHARELVDGLVRAQDFRFAGLGMFDFDNGPSRAAKWS
jgi:hypothetical protein